MTVTKIYNPREPVFGPLSNNYVKPFFIDSDKYGSVSNFMYSNLLSKKGSNKLLLKNGPVKNIFKLYKNLLFLESKELVFEIINISIEKLLNFSETFRKALIETKNYYIIYQSDNKLFGVDSNGDGENLYGKLLMQHRLNLLMKKENIEKDQTKSKEEKLIESMLH